MMFKFVRFNRYLLFVVVLAVVVMGCESMGHKKKKHATLMELHLEVNADGASDTEIVQISHDPSVPVTVEKEFFIDNADIVEALVVDELGGFKIQVKFNWRGTQILESITSANRGKRIAVLCGFGEIRWLGAPVIRNKITDGVFGFTPDATRAEAERIVKGLNEISVELKKEDDRF